jgi:hypothetical protein
MNGRPCCDAAKEIPMKRFTHILAATILGVAMLTLGGQNADAGRIGGPATDIATVPTSQSIYFDVPFAAGSPAVVSITGGGTTNVDLYVYDADGNVTQGVGFGDRKAAVIGVYRTGYFRVEVRNTGLVPSTVVISTN